jgi:hypothetical protein
VYDTAVRIHQALGMDPQDPDTTWRGSRYEPPVNANHEANANNRWHLLLLALAAALACVKRNRVWMLYTGGLLLAFLLFCEYLKWQPFLARLELPLFILAAPLAAFLLDEMRPAVLPISVCVFLLSGARPALFENWTRPLKGPRSLFVTTRDDNYFADMAQWNNRTSYLEAVDRTAQSGCTLIGLDISENQLEYPFQALLGERTPAAWFAHTGVQNASAKYAPPNQPPPCAVLCPDCIGNQQKLALYSSIGPPIEIGRFLLFLPRPHVILSPSK